MLTALPVPEVTQGRVQVELNTGN